MYSSLLVALAFIGSVSCHGLPQFSWDGSRSSEYGVPHLIITFPDGQSDVALLERYNPIPVSGTEREMDVDACIFRGRLLEDPSVPLAITGGCPFGDSFEITILSDKLSHNIYKMENGIVTANSVPWSRDQMGAGSLRDVALAPPQEAHPNASENTVTERNFPPNGFVAVVKLYSDASFRAQFGAETVNTMRKVMAHAQTYYYMKDSLTFTVGLLSAEPSEIPDSITAETYYLEHVKQYCKDPEVNFNVFLAYQYNEEGTFGYGWIGTVCSKDLGLRASISEHYNGDANTGRIMAHEMGHNLGMNHDFINGGDRYDYYGQKCTNTGGVMDYAEATRWSSCSLQDFYRYYGQFNQFCLGANPYPVK